MFQQISDWSVSKNKNKIKLDNRSSKKFCNFEDLTVMYKTFKTVQKKLLVRNHEYTYVPSGGLTLIVWTQKWGFSCKVQRRPPADIFLNENVSPKTPCRHHVHGRHGHGNPLKDCWRFSRFCKKYKTLNLTLKIYILPENGFKELTLVLFKSLF
jgi:hypothetical protein